MNQQLMKRKITAYIKTAYQWHATGNGSLIEGIGRKMADLEEDILIGFGLPLMAFQYSELLQLEGFSTKNIKERVSKLFNVLVEEGTQFLLSPIEKDQLVLKQSKEKLQDATEVLPMIGLSTTVYNLFLYYDFYFRNIVTEDELLMYLKKAEVIDEVAATRIPFTYETLINGSHVKRLTNAGFPFIKDYRQFLKYVSTLHPWNQNIVADESKVIHKLSGSFELRHFFITYIATKSTDTAVVEILAKHKNCFRKLRVWCTIEMTKLIMLHAKYYSLAIPPLYVINPRYLKEGEVHLWLKDSIGKNIEIENIVLGLRKFMIEDKKIPYCSVAYIHPTIQMTTVSGNMYDDGLPF